MMMMPGYRRLPVQCKGDQYCDLHFWVLVNLKPIKPRTEPTQHLHTGMQRVEPLKWLRNLPIKTEEEESFWKRFLHFDSSESVKSKNAQCLYEVAKEEVAQYAEEDFKKSQMFSPLGVFTAWPPAAAFPGWHMEGLPEQEAHLQI